MTRHASLEADHEPDFRPFARSLDETSPSLGGAKGRGKRTRFQTQVSVSEVPLSREDLPRGRLSSSSSMGGPSPSRTGNAPSHLLNKVKARIREKVFQSSEWPSAAAMIHEKRQRANTALEASLTARTNLDLEQIQMHELYRKKTCRSKSDSTRYDITVSGSEEDTVRQAFIRRRSISEDTYDRPSSSITLQDGVLCSREDLQAIVTGHKGFGSRLRRSPRPMKRHMRAVSLDSDCLTRAVLEPPVPSAPLVNSQVSVDSTSTVSSTRTADSGGSVSSVRPEELPTCTQDALANEVIAEEDSADNSNENSNEGGKATPVPEVVFDEHGQTWDVYGADFDPEILGEAIQRHLERMMSRGQVSTTPANRPTDSSTTKASETSFWFRLLCLFSSREVASWGRAQWV